jgi:predicted transcriptional regulator
MKTKNKESKPLTEVELELMNILWKIGEGSVHHVIDQLPKTRTLAYTSVSTMLRILEQKEIVGSRKEGKGHIYFPLLSKEEYEAFAVQSVVQKVFDGAPVAMVKQLLDSTQLTTEELKEIQTLLSSKLE